MDLTRPTTSLLLLIMIVVLMSVESKKTGPRRKCKTPKTCKKLGGACQAKDACNTFLVENGGCPGTCGCCVKKAKKCKPTSDCIKAGGFCVKKAKLCTDGDVIGACKCKKKKKGVCCVPTKPTWSYAGEDGPITWKDNWATCGEDHQSPVNVNTTEVKEMQSLRGSWGTDDGSDDKTPAPMEFTLYDRKPTKIYLKNDGNLLSMIWKAPAKPFISGGGLDGSGYLLDHLQFHWGNDTTTGSEHAIDHNKFPLEMQLYHYKSSYGSMEKALQEEDGVAALAVMFQVADENNTALADILNQMDEGLVPSPDNGEVEMKYNQPLSAFLPSSTSSYYRYMGSLTQPGCEEAVIWTLFASTVNVSDYQLNQFRRVLNSDNEPMQNNYRPLQALGDREVFFSSGEEEV